MQFFLQLTLSKSNDKNKKFTFLQIKKINLKIHTHTHTSLCHYVFTILFQLPLHSRNNDCTLSSFSVTLRFVRMRLLIKWPRNGHETFTIRRDSICSFRIQKSSARLEGVVFRRRTDAPVL